VDAPIQIPTQGGHGIAPPVVLSATHVSALEFVDLNDLKAHAIDL